MRALLGLLAVAASTLRAAVLDHDDDVWSDVPGLDEPWLDEPWVLDERFLQTQGGSSSGSQTTTSITAPPVAGAPPPLRLAVFMGGFSAATFTAPYQRAWCSGLAVTVNVTTDRITLNSIADALGGRRRQLQRALAAATVGETAVTFGAAVQLTKAAVDADASLLATVTAAVAAVATNSSRLRANFVAAQRASADVPDSAVVDPGASLALETMSTPTPAPPPGLKWWPGKTPLHVEQLVLAVVGSSLLLLICCYAAYDCRTADAFMVRQPETTAQGAEMLEATEDAQHALTKSVSL